MAQILILTSKKYLKHLIRLVYLDLLVISYSLQLPASELSCYFTTSFLF